MLVFLCRAEALFNINNTNCRPLAIICWTEERESELFNMYLLWESMGNQCGGVGVPHATGLWTTKSNTYMYLSDVHTYTKCTGHWLTIYCRKVQLPWEEKDVNRPITLKCDANSPQTPSQHFSLCELLHELLLGCISSHTLSDGNIVGVLICMQQWWLMLTGGVTAGKAFASLWD